MRVSIILIFLPCFLSAQSDFLKDPDIIWAAEIEQDWVVDPPVQEEDGISIHTLKLYSKELQRIYYLMPSLYQYVGFSFASGRLTVFEDAACTKSVSWTNVFPNTDKYCFHPDRNDEFGGNYSQNCDVSEIKTWRLRQVLAYHKKTASWSTKVLSIAPLQILKNEKGDTLGIRPMFWFRPSDERPNLKSEKIVWAKKTVNLPIKTRVLAKPEQIVKVSEGTINPLFHFLEVLKTDMKIPFYNAWNEAPLTPAERINAISPPSTMNVTFDPVSLQDTVITTRAVIDPDDIQQLQLIQTWYWDNKLQRLSICLDAVAPLIKVYDEKSNSMKPRILFFRRSAQ